MVRNLSRNVIIKKEGAGVSDETILEIVITEVTVPGWDAKSEGR